MLATVCTQVHDHGRDWTKKACLACFDGVSLIQDHDLGCQRLQLVLQLGYKVVAGDKKLKLFAFQLAVLALQQNQGRWAVLLPGDVCISVRMLKLMIVCEIHLQSSTR